MEHIGFEICEDNLTSKEYLNKVYKEAIELCVYLCKKFNLTEEDIIDHVEGSELGIASGHSDVRHWFPKFGKSMDIFREDVKVGLNENADTKKGLCKVQIGAPKKRDNAEIQLKKAIDAGFKDAYVKLE